MIGRGAAIFGTRRRLFTVVLCLVAVALIVRPSRPAIIRIGEPGSIRGEVLIFVANPLRDRAPEEVAERLLGMLKDGKCIEAFKFAGENDEARIDDEARIQEACAIRATSLPVIRWRFIDRVDQDGVVNLQYQCELQRWEEYLSVKVSNSSGKWRIISWAFPPGA